MSIASDGGRAAVDGEALDWALRMAEPDADWDAFTAWLEGDPGRAARYGDAVTALDRVTADVAAAARSGQMVANDRDGPSAGHVFGRRAWLGGAVAAALVGVVGLGIRSQRDESFTVATRPGEQRTIDLADGSSIALAGGSRVKLDPASPRSATIEAGEMLFTVRHDATDPFRVKVRDLELVDLGTVFDVGMSGSRTRVAVAEGAVMIARPGGKVRLGPGQAAEIDGTTVRLERQDVADIGGWRRGVLTFNDATMNEVAEQLSRNLGLRVAAGPSVRERVFNGTLEMTALRRDPALLSGLLDVRVRHDGDVWLLEARR